MKFLLSAAALALLAVTSAQDTDASAVVASEDTDGDDTAPYTKYKIDFYVLGDWGKYEKEDTDGEEGNGDDEQPVSETIFQEEVAEAMILYRNSRNISLDYIVSVGDNFYMEGVMSAFDTLWDTVWRDVYLKMSDALRVPWHAVLGNHDYGSGVAGTDAQIERSTATDDFEWDMPDYNYFKSYSALGNLTVHTVYVDTNTLAPAENKITGPAPSALWRMVFTPIRWAYNLITPYVEHNRIQLQLNYLERDLQAGAEADWLVVVGHHPVFSPGSNGDTQELQRAFMGLLEQYGVDAYFCGHDHLSAHMRNNGIEYFLAGAGAMTGEVKSNTSAQELLFVGESYSAFVYSEVFPENFTVSYINNTGHAVYTYTMFK